MEQSKINFRLEGDITACAEEIIELKNKFDELEKRIVKIEKSEEGNCITNIYKKIEDNEDNYPRCKCGHSKKAHEFYEYPQNKGKCSECDCMKFESQLLKTTKDEQISNSKFTLKGKFICVIDNDDTEVKVFHAYEKEDVNRARKEIIRKINDYGRIKSGSSFQIPKFEVIEIVNEVSGDEECTNGEEDLAEKGFDISNFDIKEHDNQIKKEIVEAIFDKIDIEIALHNILIKDCWDGYNKIKRSFR